MEEYLKDICNNNIEVIHCLYYKYTNGVIVFAPLCNPCLR